MTPAEVDDCFTLLASRQRRYLLSLLCEYESVDLLTLAREIAAWEREKPSVAVTDDELDRVVVALQHKHLPLLEEEGVVNYDRQSHVVRYLGADCLESLLEYAAGIEC